MKMCLTQLDMDILSHQVRVDPNNNFLDFTVVLTYNERFLKSAIICRHVYFG